MKTEQLSQAYKIARSAIGRMSDVSAYLEDFNDEMDGSSITDELNCEVEKAEKRLVNLLNKQFKQAFGNQGEIVIKNY